MRIQDIISETTAGAVAGVATALGAGDPNASIYSNKKKKQQKLIKRVHTENKNDTEKN